MTSIDVIRRLQKQLGIKKMGHAGTLDPMATGLMIIGVEGGTKKLKHYVGLSKTCEAEIIVGVKTDTSDIEGVMLEDVAVTDVDEQKVKTVLAGMVGILRLPVSGYSAMKQGGEPLYKKVRSGKPFIQPLRDMEVHSHILKNVRMSEGKVYVRVVFEVGSGTYIRSLAEELGKRLGYPATLGALRRTHIGEFSLGDVTTSVSESSWQKG